MHVLTFVGQNLGAGKTERILKGVNEIAFVMGYFISYLVLYFTSVREHSLDG